MYDFYILICAVFVASVVAGKLLLWLLTMSSNCTRVSYPYSFRERFTRTFLSLRYSGHFVTDDTPLWRKVSIVVRGVPFIPLRIAGFVCAELVLGPVRTVAWWFLSGWRATIAEPRRSPGGPMPVRIVDRDGYDR
jgi:hypothetical protein